MGVPGVDFPEARDVVDVMVPGRGEVLLSRVETGADADIVVTVGETRHQRRLPLPVGERLELVWKGPEDLRSLPVEIVALLPGETPLWQLRPVGPSSRGQRRSAVRAELAVPFSLRFKTDEAAGTTIDVSEGGARGVFATPTDVEDADSIFVQDLEPGDPVTVRLGFDEGEMTCRAEVVRRFQQRPDHRPEVTFKFVGLSEKDADRVRAQVFVQLRTQLARRID
ncbi:PilZ domain-containing protein [Nocardioides seonyuensis]|uniref:PilZ domain-containing protein n=1 Tax=Nocardioides seonyuensis TaxID=2518371 RepID=A0A4P7IF19_9ACTN|nr:PilZ domain-containing protein [Nocardioides seonyuensis]QBX55370.1 PilZ domain-containing protein [Nocardioides seonyuensis]